MIGLASLQRNAALVAIPLVMSVNESHLQTIQSVISRMAQNSFTLKGWAVTLISAVFALSAKDSNARIALVAYLPAVTFWMLDAYYLWQERLFRRLFDVMRVVHPPAGDTTDFSMNVRAAVQSASQDERKRLTYWSSLWSITQTGLYIPLLIAITLMAWVIGAFRAI